MSAAAAVAPAASPAPTRRTLCVGPAAAAGEPPKALCPLGEDAVELVVQAPPLAGAPECGGQLASRLAEDATNDWLRLLLPTVASMVHELTLQRLTDVAPASLRGQIAALAAEPLHIDWSRVRFMPVASVQMGTRLSSTFRPGSLRIGIGPVVRAGDAEG